MAPEFHIQVDDLPFPFKDCIEGNVPIFAPQSEYLASLQPIRKSIYEQLLEQQWTEEECYDYFTFIEKYMGFESVWLRHKGWKEQKIQDWSEACAHKELYFLPGLKQDDLYQQLSQMAGAAQRCIASRELLKSESVAKL
ncbi:hypothetical protein N7520_000551 [Penicillium odoratum]|uniref:uncharacterized protein n=1 Tax=Penicillium odoratum TaxID=1167516 RepID=UPI002547470A|nr:uncharacterized protein N7520_000551 [Penicillium odoratum]KAJ5777305.1 hypothetical protein N7520_000551 [Penicillium odoratum]